MGESLKTLELLDCEALLTFHKTKQPWGCPSWWAAHYRPPHRKRLVQPHARSAQTALKYILWLYGVLDVCCEGTPHHTLRIAAIPKL